MKELDPRMVRQKHGGALKPLRPGERLPGAGRPRGPSMKTILRELLDGNYDPKRLGRLQALAARSPLEAMCVQILCQAIDGDVRSARWVADMAEPKE